MSGALCYRCGKKAHHIDNVRDFQHWGFVDAETETTTARTVRIRATNISRLNTSRESILNVDEKQPLCFGCYNELMKFLGVGKRKEWLR